jgi:hypothetical protein
LEFLNKAKPSVIGSDQNFHPASISKQNIALAAQYFENKSCLSVAEEPKESFEKRPRTS